MITPRPHLLAAIILSLVACSTQHLDGFDIYQPINPSNPSLVWLDSSLPAQMGHVRIKVDGKFLIYDYGASFSYIELYAGSARESVMITPGEQLDLVGSAGETLLHFEPPVPFSHPHRVWVHDSPTGFEGMLLEMVADGDTTTAEVVVVNVTGAERVVVSRCVGSPVCDGCVTAPVGKNEFSLSECAALGTVGPGEQWTVKPETTTVSAGAGAACVVAQEEGSVRGRTCVVELNRPAYGFRERSYILIDGTILAPQPDGAVATYPSVWVQPP